MDLDEFFNGRTIGFSNEFEWTWRGPGYDEGWDTPTIEELKSVRSALDQYLKMKGE